MIRNLKISNYALIDTLEIDLVPGFITITGETGAGKSILMGALSLILGQRAETGVMLNKEKKCIVEGEFSIDPRFKDFFESNDLDYEEHSLIRREILPGGNLETVTTVGTGISCFSGMRTNHHRQYN